jgi:hypothetical protein
MEVQPAREGIPPHPEEGTPTVLERDAASTAPAALPAPPRESTDAPAAPKAEWEARHDLDRHRAETERLRVLVEFLARPIHAPGGAEPDPDIVTAYNLAVEAALVGIRRAAAAG